MEEFAWSRAQTRISIFSAQQYVANYLTPPFQAAGYLNLNFIDVSVNCALRCSKQPQQQQQTWAGGTKCLPVCLHTTTLSPYHTASCR